MPAKKTFPSIRVRGGAQFDVVPTVRGVPVAPHRLYRAMILMDGPDWLQVSIMVNTFPAAPVITRANAGSLHITLPGAFTGNKTFCTATLGSEIFAGRTLAIGRAADDLVTLLIFDEAGAPADSFQAQIEVAVYL